MNKAIAILVCIATFAIILMFAMASAEESADAGELGFGESGSLLFWSGRFVECSERGLLT